MAVIKIPIKTDSFEIYSDLGKNFSAALVHGIYGTEAETPARFRKFRVMRGTGGNDFPKKRKTIQFETKLFKADCQNGAYFYAGAAAYALAFDTERITARPHFQSLFRAFRDTAFALHAFRHVNIDNFFVFFAHFFLPFSNIKISVSKASTQYTGLTMRFSIS